MKNVLQLLASVALLSLIVLATMAMTPDPVRKLPVYRIKMTRTDGSSFWAESAAGRPLKIKTAKGALGISSGWIDDSLLWVKVLRFDGPVTDLDGLSITAMKEVKSGKLSRGVKFSHTLESGVRIDIGLTGAAVEGDGEPRCCSVTCPDGTVLSGCPVRSSCGNCGAD